MTETLKQCPVCEDDRIHHYLTVKGYTDGAYWLCEECGAAFLNPRMEDEDLFWFYESGAYRAKTELQDKDSVLAHKQHLERANYLSAMIGKFPIESHLDIGCSSGELMRTVREQHPSVIRSLGVDIDTVLTQDEFEVVDNIDDVEGEWDLITVIHTLEHINDPCGLMTKIYPRLSYGGLLMVEVPNRRSTVVAFAPPQHVIAFDEGSLKMSMSLFNLTRTVLHGMPDMSPLDLNILQFATK